MEQTPDKEDGNQKCVVEDGKTKDVGDDSDHEWRADGDAAFASDGRRRDENRSTLPTVRADESNNNNNIEVEGKTEGPLEPVATPMAPITISSEKETPRTPLYPSHVVVKDGDDSCVSSITDVLGVYARPTSNQLYPAVNLTIGEQEEAPMFQPQNPQQLRVPSTDELEEVARKPAAVEATSSSGAPSRQQQVPMRSLVDMERDIVSKGHARVIAAPLAHAEHQDNAASSNCKKTGASLIAVGIHATENMENSIKGKPSEVRSSKASAPPEQAMVESYTEVAANAPLSDTAIAPSRPLHEPGAYSVRTPASFRPPGEAGVLRSSASTNLADLRSSSSSATGAASPLVAPMSPVTATLAPFDCPDDTSENEESENGDQSNGNKPCLVLGARIEPESPIDSRLILWVIIPALVVIVVLLSLGLAGVFVASESSNSDIASTVDDFIGSANDTGFITLGNMNGTNATTTSRLEQIRHRGYLTCMRVPNPSFMEGLPVLEQVGNFNPAFCYAVAAAIWGPETQQQHRVKLVDFDFFNIAYHPTDINPIGMLQTMSWNVYPNNDTGHSFTAPFMFDGYTVSGDPFFVDCFDNKSFKHVDECQDLQLCVPGQNTGWDTFAHTVLPARKITSIDDFNGVMEAFVNGECNIFIIFAVGQSELVIRNVFGYDGNYTVGSKFYTREVRAVVTQSDDTEWSIFVSVVVQTLLAAEQHNITQATAHLMPQTEVFGDDYKDMLKHVIGAMGNYGEIYDRYLAAVLPRSAVNSINDGSTGLLYALQLDDQPQAPEYNRELGPRLHHVLERGRLLCGVRCGRPGFATASSDDAPVSGMDVDFCRAVGASLFGGNIEAVDFIEVVDQAGGFQMLANGEVDLVAGASWNLANSVREPGTGLGFAFSQPYFYNPDPSDLVEPNLCLATMHDDHDWKTYVYYVVAGTIYAEEKGIRQRFYNNMPLVYVYGDGLHRMFRDAILGVGSYADIFERNLESRSGRNLLNPPNRPGPGLYPMPGIIV